MGPPDKRDLDNDRPAALFGRLYPTLVVAARRLGFERDAQDLAQEALVETLVRYPAFEGLAHPAAYTRTVLYRLASRHARRRIPDQGELSLGLADALESSSPDVSDEVISRLSAAFVLRRLPPRQRACLYLTFVEGFSDAEISEILGCRPSTVRSQIGRGLRSLARSLAWDEDLASLGLMTNP